MTGEPSKTGGNLKATEGAIRENVGSFFGNDEQQAKGAAKRAEGTAEHDTAQAKGYLEGVTDSIVGTVKDTVGSLTGNTQQQAEGKAQSTKGDAEKAANS